MLLAILKAKKLLKRFTRKNCKKKKKKNQKEFRVKKIIKGKGDKLYVYMFNGHVTAAFLIKKI